MIQRSYVCNSLSRTRYEMMTRAYLLSGSIDSHCKMHGYSLPLAGYFIKDAWFLTKRHGSSVVTTERTVSNRQRQSHCSSLFRREEFLALLDQQATACGTYSFSHPRSQLYKCRLFNTQCTNARFASIHLKCPCTLVCRYV